MRCLVLNRVFLGGWQQKLRNMVQETSRFGLDFDSGTLIFFLTQEVIFSCKIQKSCQPSLIFNNNIVTQSLT